MKKVTRKEQIRLNRKKQKTPKASVTPIILYDTIIGPKKIIYYKSVKFLGKNLNIILIGEEHSNNHNNIVKYLNDNVLNQGPCIDIFLEQWDNHPYKPSAHLSGGGKESIYEIQNELYKLSTANNRLLRKLCFQVCKINLAEQNVDIRHNTYWYQSYIKVYDLISQLYNMPERVPCDFERYVQGSYLLSYNITDKILIDFILNEMDSVDEIKKTITDEITLIFKTNADINDFLKLKVNLYFEKYFNLLDVFDHFKTIIYKQISKCYIPNFIQLIKDNLDIWINRKYKIIFKSKLPHMYAGLYMDIYTLARMFRTFDLDKRDLENNCTGYQYPSNIIFYGGYWHTENYKLFFEKLGMIKPTYQYTSKQLPDSIKIPSRLLTMFADLKI